MKDEIDRVYPREGLVTFPLKIEKDKKAKQIKITDY